MKILILYDGTLNAKKALRYGIEKIKASGGELLVLQAFDRVRFVDYDAGPRAEEMARADAARQRDEAQSIIDNATVGGSVRIVAEEGTASDLLSGRAAADRPDLVLLTPGHRSLATSVSCPVMVIPGTVLVPVDAAGADEANIDSIAAEAAATGSGVLLLGVVPVHLYSKEERKELQRVQKSTAAAMRRLKVRLQERGVAVRESVRQGYPDEEILKAAAEHAASLILLPSGGATPSEISKAAAILLDAPERLRWPVFLLPATAA